MGTRAERLHGVTERRSVGMTDFEVRSNGDALQFDGYASLFDVGYEMYGGPDKGGWIETVDPKAFDRTLSAKPDVVLNLNHGEGGTGLPLARTTSGTLELRADKKGLRPTASLDLRDPDVQALQVKVERGDVNQMSFAFRTIRQEWNDEEDKRRLLELSLNGGDVSIVTNGASPTTSFQLRGLTAAIAALSSMDREQAEIEVRALAADEMSQIMAAYTLLGELMSSCEVEEPGEPADGAGMNSTTDPAEESARTSTLSLKQAQRLHILDRR